MVRMRRLTVAVALMLVASMAASAWASCMSEIGMTAEAQMACCQHGHDKCPMRQTTDDCCKLDSQRHAQLNVATHELARSDVHPPALLPAIGLASFVPVFARLSGPLSEHDVLKGPSPPPYLSGSAFLV